MLAYSIGGTQNILKQNQNTFLVMKKFKLSIESDYKGRRQRNIVEVTGPHMYELSHIYRVFGRYFFRKEEQNIVTFSEISAKHLADLREQQALSESLWVHARRGSDIGVRYQ